ncbi:MAG: Ig-like domain-containing protein [Caldilineaceae bacterium]
MAAQSISAQSADGPTLTVQDGLSVNAGSVITVPIAFASNGSPIAGIGLSLDFDQTCLAFDASDADGNHIPDAIHFDLSPQFVHSVAYDAADTDGEIDILIADYTPPLATLADSAQLIRVRFTAVCQPESPAGQESLINFSTRPAVTFSDLDGRDVSGSAISNAVLILPPPGFTPQPTPTATPTVTPIPTATATPVPVEGNNAPLVANDSAVTNEDTAIVIDVLANDSDPDGDSLTVGQLGLPQHGASTRNADNTITYVPAANYFGSDSFSYTVSDGRGGALTAAVNITIRAVNDGPVILIAPSDQVNRVGDAVTLLISASDPDTAEDALIYSAQNLPPGITVDSQRGLLTGTLTDDAIGAYQVVTTVSDGALSDSVQFQWVVKEGAAWCICRL